MNDASRRLALALAALLAAPATARAAPEPRTNPVPEPLTPGGAVAAALAHDPSLAAAVLEARRAALAVRSEDARYVPSLSARIDYSHDETPTLTSSGVVVGRSDSLAARFGVDHQFAWGTLVAAELSLAGSGSRSTAFGLAAPVSLGPGYAVDVRLALTQPLWRGLGRDVGEALLRSARREEQAARIASDEAASTAVRDVLGAYWELWYAERAAAIEGTALATAARRLAEAEARLAAGALAPFDVLPLRSEHAGRAEAVATAEAAVAQAQTTLARALGVAPTTPLALAADGPSPVPDSLDAPDAIARAAARAYALAALQAAVDVAKIQLTLAEDIVHPKLDAGAWLQVSGLGNQRVDDAFAQLGTFGAVSGGVTLALALPAVSDARAADAARARLAAQTAREHLRDAEQRLAAEIAALVVQRRAAHARIAFAEDTARLAAETARGQAARFASGAGTALDLVIADQQQREAELRIVRAQVDEELARLALAHLTGDLLGETPTPTDRAPPTPAP